MISYESRRVICLTLRQFHHVSKNLYKSEDLLEGVQLTLHNNLLLFVNQNGSRKG